ncbi:type IX secretion system periplasmic lipoprotein PorW/SprE [Bergeyella sp. RCAD1439]|uniref:type IX secretion system periplasmic lipoprotein PorW/SprE n=1 Tax=Bergeyella anatis TaxID=3113737 RepID=UPI002E16CF70|nr:tetratricopeptide repeat protein [Bergeyella sp. RCAD1439]
MKKTLFWAFGVLIFAVACKSRNPEKRSGASAGFFAYYNTLFNSKEALHAELQNRKASHKDDFYAPYIPLMQFEQEPLGGEISRSSAFAESGGGFFSSVGGSRQGTRGASSLQIAENKALKAISKYSVQKSGEEKNKRMFEAHLLLAQSRLYQGRALEALDALGYIFLHMKKDKRVALARIYQAYAYAKLGDFHQAEGIFSDLNNAPLPKAYARLHSVYFSEALLASGKKEAAVEQLSQAFTLNKNRELRSRIAFLRGQILANLGRGEEARESFVTAYKYANDFEFEVKAQLAAGDTFEGNEADYDAAKKYMEGIAKKGTYASRKNEFYYALGRMAAKAGRPEEAKVYFDQAKRLKMSDPQVRGLTYYEIGKYHADRKDYISAGAYYDSALAVMTYAPMKEDLTLLAKNIKKLSSNYYLVRKNDSILALTRMSEPQRVAYFTQYIDKLKAKEAKEEAEKKKKERTEGFDTGDYNANSIFANNTGSVFQDFTAGTGNKSTFYFANQNTVSKGQADFKRLWGNRSLVDNWRVSTRSASLDDVKKEALGLDAVQNPRRFEPSFYIEKIPTDAEVISALKKERDTASLGLGRMYEQYFSDTKLATKTLYDLVDNRPEDEVKLQALYQIFSMNYEKSPSDAEKAKALILSEFPYTPYAEFVKNPKQSGFSSFDPRAEERYQEAFRLYSEENYEESKAVVAKALEDFSQDALVPKFYLLNAFNAGKTAGKEIMILQLQQIALNYPKTPEGVKATEILRYMKSDLDEVSDGGKTTLKQPEKKVETPTETKILGQSLFPGDTPMTEEEIRQAEEEFEKANKRPRPQSVPVR